VSILCTSYGRKGADLASREDIVARNVEDILNELRNGISTNPHVHVLSVFDEEQAMSLQSLGREGLCRWKDDAVLASSARLMKTVNRTNEENKWMLPLVACCATNRTLGTGRA
jgi:hypothetical protein